jgi:hypothetical protein
LARSEQASLHKRETQSPRCIPALIRQQTHGVLGGCSHVSLALSRRRRNKETMRITVVVVVVSSLLSACRNIKKERKGRVLQTSKAQERLIVPRSHVNIGKKESRQKNANRFCFCILCQESLERSSGIEGYLAP